MVDEQFRVDAEQTVQQILVVVVGGPPERTAGDVAHGHEPVGFELLRVSAPDSPEVGKRPMSPEQPAVRRFVELRDAHAFGVGRHMLGHDVHGHFGQVQVGADTRGGSDAGLAVDRPHDVARQFVRGFAVGVQVPCNVHEHLVDGIHVNVVRGGVPQVDAVYFPAGVEIMRHSRLGYIHAGSQIRISCERFRIIRFTSQHTARCRCPPCSIDFFKLRFDFEQSRPPRQSICFERWRHGKTDGFVGARLVGHYQMRG